MSAPFELRHIGPDAVDAAIAPLAEVLLDCVEGGASVSFMWPLPRERALDFWRGVADGVKAGERLLLVGADRASGRIDGTVQVVLAQPDNQPHRADVAKMLVHRRARRNGLAQALLAEPQARPCWCSTPSPAATPSASTRAAAGSVSARFRTMR